MGKVGTGWSRTVSSQIRKQLNTVISPKSKLTKPIKKPKATWVEPSFTAEVEFRDITSEGLLRQSSFKGLSLQPGGQRRGLRGTNFVPPLREGCAMTFVEQSKTAQGRARPGLRGTHCGNCADGKG
jgi:hypothetical protein